MNESHEQMGRRLRELRGERGLSQGEVAQRLSISAAYLSLIEKGKRPVQLPLLFKALEVYGVTMEAFMASLGEARVDDGLARLLDEPLLRSLRLGRDDVSALGAEPRVAATIATLFNLYKNTRGQLENLLADVARRERDEATRGAALGFDYSPFDEVTDFLEAHGNYFFDLEERADAFRAEAALGESASAEALSAALEERLGIRVAFVAGEGASSVIRRFDREAATLRLSVDVPEHRRRFQLAHTIGLSLLDEGDLFARLVVGFTPAHSETSRLLKIHLANYFAGALLLPYATFYAHSERTRYDVDRLASIFSSSYETVAHRLCNLSSPSQKGVPFHFLRVDVAGNISKRYSSTGLKFPHGTGSCPKWAVHGAFLTPHEIHRQYSEFPDGSRYFCFARVVSEPHGGSLARGTVYGIGLGTQAENASRLAYADDMPFVDPARMAVPVGTTCRFCERTDCNQRAAPSYKFAFRVDEYIKKDNFFSPLVSEDERPAPEASASGKR